MKIRAIVVARMFPVLTLTVWASHVFPGAALGEMVRVFQTITNPSDTCFDGRCIRGETVHSPSVDDCAQGQRCTPIDGTRNICAVVCETTPIVRSIELVTYNGALASLLGVHKTTRWRCMMYADLVRHPVILARACRPCRSLHRITVDIVEKVA